MITSEIGFACHQIKNAVNILNRIVLFAFGYSKLFQNSLISINFSFLQASTSIPVMEVDFHGQPVPLKSRLSLAHIGIKQRPNLVLPIVLADLQGPQLLNRTPQPLQLQSHLLQILTKGP